MDRPIRVLMAGSTTKVKGGMTTLVQSFLDHRFSSQIDLTYVPTHTDKGKFYNSLYFALKTLNMIVRFCTQRPHIVHLHMSDKGSFFRKYILFKLSKIFSRKTVIHTHGGDFKAFYSRIPGWAQLWVNEMLRDADKIIALGDNWERIFKEIESDTDVIVLRNSVPIPKQHKKLPDQKQISILFLAVLNESKGILDLIQSAVGLLRKAEAEGRELVFDIGGDGPCLQEAIKLAAELEVSEAFRFHGWVDGSKKRELLKNADVFVLPSYFEGLPMSVLEAISYGLPVVATDVGSMDEAVKEDVNGYLIQPADIRALEDRLEHVIFSGKIQEMGQASRKLAEEKFDETIYFTRLEDLYKELAGANDLKIADSDTGL